MDIETQIMIDLHEVVRNVTVWAQELLLDYIDEYVYEWGRQQKRIAATQYNQLTMYYMWNNFQPTMQFRNSIIFEQMHTDIADYIGYMIYSDPMQMEYDGVDNLHGNKMYDYRATLMERLNEGKDDMPNAAKIRWWKNRPPFFDMYLKRLEGEIYPRFEYEMSKMGWNWRREA